MNQRKPRVPKASKYDKGFTADFCDLGKKLALLGATDVEIANVLGITPSTLYNWREVHPEFAKALQEGKQVADAEVASKLLARALGYEHDDTDIRVVDKRIVKTKIRKHYPPDTTACIFWLKNRAREQWRDKVETGLTDKEGNDVTAPDLTDVARRMAFILAKAADKT